MRRALLLAVACAVLLVLPAAAETAVTEVAELAAAPVATALVDAVACPAATSADAPFLDAAEAEEGIEGIGTPEPTSMICADEWDEYRWVYAGCCLNTKKTKQQKRHCCFNNNGVSCGSWSDTGSINCSGPCPI